MYLTLSSGYTTNSIWHNIHTAALREISPAPQGRNWSSWRSNLEKKMSSVNFIHPVNLCQCQHAGGSEAAAGGDRKGSSSTGLCWHRHSVSVQPWTSCRTHMNKDGQCQCPDQMKQCQVQQWVSSSVSQQLLRLGCYHCFYSVSMIYHWLCQLCPLLHQMECISYPLICR